MLSEFPLPDDAIGQAVTVTGGPLAGMTGKIDALPGDSRDGCMILSDGLSADGFELSFSHRGYTWTWQVGARAPFIESREDYLRHYGATSLPGQGRRRKAA